ncbi:right-handed parallel beta-helix repeat-containing protein [Methanosarcina siciliae]|nr:right-handed parallel beta-helix repeat-containing protein [Methanosarcina siciliae]
MNTLKKLLIIGIISVFLTMSVGIGSAATIINGDWIVDDNEVRSNEEIVLYGNLIIQADSSLTLDNVRLEMNGTSDGQRSITVQQWGKLYVKNGSEITGNFYYYFENYGYLNLQNMDINRAYSIHFYDNSDDSSTINGSAITGNKGQGIYLESASPSITNNKITNSGNGIYVYRSSALIENNTISNQSYGIYSGYNYGNSLTIRNNIISNHTQSGIYYDSSNSGIVSITGNTIENNNGFGLRLYGTSATLDNNLIRNNRNYGIYTYDTVIINNSIISGSTYGIYNRGSTTVNNSAISGNNYGIYTYSGSTIINNSTINSSSYDYSATSGTITSINSEFDKSKTLVSGSGFLDVYWYDTIEVLNDYAPVSGAFVQAFDINLNEVSEGTSDDNGKVTLSIREYTQTSSTKYNLNPYKIKASKQGLPDGSIESNITESKSDTILMGQGEFVSDTPLTINGDWVINDSQSYLNKNIIIDSGNLIIKNSGSLVLSNSQLKLRYTTSSGYGIKIESGGKFDLNDSAVTASFPELGYSYNFDNYGYLNIQNSTVSGASSVHFYDNSDDSSTINGSAITGNKGQGIYLESASPSITNNKITNSGNGIYVYRSSALIENNTISNQSYGIYSGYNYGNSLTIRNNIISNHTQSGIYYDSSNSGIVSITGNTIENNNGFGLRLYGTSATLDNNLIRNNRNYGIYTYDTVIINNSIISGSTYGIYNRGSTTVNNSTINSSSYDYSVTSGTITSINSEFDKSKTLVSGSGFLDVYWYDTIEVLNNSVPVSGALVQAFDKDLSKVSEESSDENGKVTFQIREYTQTSSTKTDANPHTIKASKPGFPDGSIESYITESKKDTVLMGQGESTSELPLTINGDWTINDDRSYSDETIYLKGNLVIQEGGSLTLDNTTLLVQLLESEQYGITVQKGGQLNIKNSFLSPAYTELGFYYPFNVYSLLNIDNSTVRMAVSVYFDSLSDDNSTVINSNIIRNRDYGLYIKSNPRISGNLLQYNGNGLRIDYSSINVSDTIIERSSNYDYYIYRNSGINSINTSFDESDVYFYDSNSVLDQSWYLDIKTVDANGNPISNANISIEDSTGEQVFNGLTDSEGLVEDIVAKEYRKTKDSSTSYNPYQISAAFDNVTAQTSVNVDSNKEVTLSLNVNQPLKVTVLEPVNNSIFVQNDSISFNALGFDPQDGILTGSAIDWTSSLDGPIGSGDSFIFSGLSPGTHEITAKATNSRDESVNDSVNILVIGRSDLTVDGINWSPTKINEGETVTFNASIRNIGDGYPLSPFYVRFLADNQYIGQKRVDQLNAGESTVITQNWTATAYAENVTVVVDYYDHVKELDETNNRLTVSLSEVEQADLIVSNLTWTPENFHDGTQVTFEAEILNTGIGNASKPFDVGFYINESKIGTVTVDNNLFAGESRKVSTTWNAVPGSYVLNVKADDTNTIFESNESNNLGSAVLPSIYQPELAISNVTVPSSIDDGDTVDFNATVENTGLNSTENWFGVRFYIDGNDIGYAVIEGLTAGGNATVSKSWTAAPGIHELIVKADADGWYASPYNVYGPRINESNEINNNITLALPEVEQSDLIVSDFTWSPENFSTGDTVTFDAYIENIGNGSTLRTFNTGFTIDENLAGTKSVAGISKGESVKVSQVWTATSGDHNVSVKVDYHGQINESNESNNLLVTNLSYIEEKYLLLVSSDSQSYAENGTAVFTAKASSLASPNVYLTDSDVNLTLSILDENSSVVYDTPMNYTTAGFTTNVDLSGYPKGNYVARVALRDNNGLTAEKTVSFKVTENFSVSISTDKSIYDRNEIVHITGRAQYDDGSPVVNTPAVLTIKLKGYTRTYSLVTDSDGYFSYYFQPGSSEAGNFIAKISVNSNKLWISAETSFEMYGLYMSPSGTIDYEMSENSSENITFSIRNYGEVDLHGVTASLDGDAVTGVETQLVQLPPETLAAGAQGTFKVKINAANVDVSQANYVVSVTSDEGSSEEAELFVHLVEASPAAIVSPTSITVGMNPNDTLVKIVSISNVGYESMNDINISTPSLDWVSVSSADLGSISPGANKTFNIFLHPDNGTAAGVYQETITISSSNHQPVNIYLTISITSSEQGDLMFHVVNDIGENVSGASIAIQNPDVLTQVFQGTTDENGYYLFKNISIGTYNYFVKASNHTSVSGSSTVSPEIQTLVEPVLSKDILGVELTVTPVQIEDEYDIQLDLTFETDVPPPLLIPNPLYIRYGVNFSDPVYENDSSITISNPGLVSVFNVTVDSSSLQGVNITFPTGYTFFVDELKAQSSITIPYHLNTTYVACGGESYRNSIRIRGDYLTFEENSDVTRKVYLSSELPFFVYMYNCPVSTGPIVDVIEEYFRHDYNSPGGSYSSGNYDDGESIPQVVETVRERVKFYISQEATLERDAFAASLELTNKLADQNIENVNVNLEIKDADGNDASDLFFVNLTSLSSISSVDGDGLISPSSVASADWLLVPEKNAGGTTPSGKDYTVQAFIDYTVDGVTFSVNSTEESITVMPQPLLNLTYTIPAEVKANTPFNITLDVTNVGYGTAKNLKLDSAQPVIYENKAGLLVSFELIGSGLVDGPETDSLLIDFGDVAPGESKEAYWIMTSSLDGEFTEFKGSFSHSNALGGAETSLINSITYIIPGSVHNINKGSSFASIQAAIDDADSGNELHVDSGVYYEDVIINKQIILRGIDIGTGKPVINACWQSNAVTLYADGVVLDGFVVTGAGKKAVEVLSDGNTIVNNNISSNMQWGIYLSSKNNEITNNVINNNYYGIYLLSSSSNRIYNNRLIENDISAFDDSLNQWDNGIIGNYYSETTEMDNDLNGIMDTDYNGICDDPYPIAGGDSVDNYPLYLPQPNEPPIVSFSYTPEGLILIDQEVTFDATASYDPYGPYDGGEIVSYNWDFGDGSTGTGPIVSHTYPALGDYEVNLTLTDDDGATSYYTEVVPISSVLGEDIKFTVSETKKRLDKIETEAKSSAEDGDYFSREMTNDKIQRNWIIFEGFLEACGFMSTKLAESEYLGDPDFINNPQCHVGNTIRYIESVAWESKSDLAIGYAGELLNMVSFGELLKDNDALQNNIASPLSKAIEEYKNELDNSENVALSKISDIPENEINMYQQDLSKKRIANQLMVNYLEKNGIILHESKKYRVDENSDLYNSFMTIYAKFGLKTIATLVAGPMGAVVVGETAVIGDAVENEFKIEQDTYMYNLGLGINLDAYNKSEKVYMNTNKGLEIIESGKTPEIATGEIVSIREPVVLGVGDFFGVEYKIFPIEAYTDVTIKNTGSFDTIYELIADYQHWFFNVPLKGDISWTPVMSNGKLKIHAGRTNTIRVYHFKNGEIGDKPEKGTRVNFVIFGETDTGIYPIGTGDTVFGTKRIVTSGDLSVSQEVVDNAEILTYPIRTSIKTPINSNVYSLKILAENPFKIPISVNLSQKIPSDITVVSVDNGTIGENAINWNLYLAPEECHQIVVTFISSGEPGVMVELPQTELNIYDPVNDKTIDFLSNSNNFTTQFPIEIHAYPPTNASVGENIIVPFKITNFLSDSPYTGNILLELENFEGAEVYNSITMVTLAPNETQEINIEASPELSPGIYTMKGTWQGTKANMSIFTSYIYIDAGDVLGTVLLQNQYNNNGTEVKLGNYSTTTMPDGSYIFIGTPIGNYSLTASHSGYSDYNGEVTIGEGLNTIPQIVLEQNNPLLSSITNIQSNVGGTWINWTWTNPEDPHFNHTEIYLNNVFQTNTSLEYFNATGLQPETNYTIGTRTVDVSGNVNEEWVNASARTGFSQDNVSPVIESVILSPTTTTIGSTINVTVNVTDNIGVSSVKANEIPLLNQGGNLWDGSITALEGTHSVNVSAMDEVGNIVWDNSTSYTAIMSENLPPSSITNLQSTSESTRINWTWQNPPDPDFNHTETYLNNIFQTNTSTEFFNATGLEPETEYTISTRTVDVSGNINETWVNSTATTLAELVSDTEKPVIESVVLFPATTTAGSTINVTVDATDNIEVTEVTAGDVQLAKTDNIWQGSITAPSSIGDYSMLITAKDAAGNAVEITENYKVVAPTGSLGVGISPKVTTASTSGTTIDYTVNIKSIQNFDDIVSIDVIMDGLPASYQISSDWFEWNNQTVNVPANSTVSLPLKLTIPPGQAASRKAFKVRANSTLWITSAYDTGVIAIS